MAEGLIPVGEVRSLAKRGITEETCQKWGYTVSKMGEQTVQVANYKDDQGNIIAQKVRFPNKDFRFLGDAKAASLYGKHLWRDSGKTIVVTEGEIDALSVSQMQGNKWPVVSVKNGAQGAKKCIQKELDWLERFERVVLMFDNDEPGRKAALECAEVLSPGKACIATLPLKDANDMLKAGRSAEVINAIFGAKPFRPDGIVDGDGAWAAFTSDIEFKTRAYPWTALNEKTGGLAQQELVIFTAGTGIGKSQATREIEYALARDGERVGTIRLEESVQKSAKGIVGIHLNKPLMKDLRPWSALSDEEKAERTKAFDEVIRDRIFFYDHFGSLESENLLNRIRYMVKSLGCRWIILDHISIVISGMDDGDERKTLDILMTKLRSLVQETGCGLIAIVHLRRKDGKAPEDGGQVSLSDLRGSQSIAQLSDMVIALERDQQAEGAEADVTAIRVLKNRRTGETGLAGHLRYVRETGRLVEFSPDFGPDGEGAATDIGGSDF